MDSRTFLGPLEDIGNSVKDYAGNRLDQLKLKTTKRLSASLAVLFAWVVIVMVILVAFSFLALALGAWLGEILGSQAYGMLIISGIFLVVALVLFLLRKRIFVNGLVRAFISIFFEKNEISE
ncbi:MAG TPA: hypothetical protein PK922_14350 [Syntrophorhabdus sp.]|jgi:Zn-dependent protease with chaperone function|nr:hypothetical protein [Syntrophorhabdus sp.]